MTKLYPDIEPFASGTLEVSNGHRLYWEENGNPEGTPAVYLHGGPGSGCSPGARRNFDPKAYRAVLFDQRGCGRSHPLASEPDADLSTNTTDLLIADIEILREHLSIARWVVLTVFAFPAAYQRRLRTGNGLERLTRKLRRRLSHRHTLSQ